MGRSLIAALVALLGAPPIAAQRIISPAPPLSIVVPLGQGAAALPAPAPAALSPLAPTALPGPWAGASPAAVLDRPDGSPAWTRLVVEAREGQHPGLPGVRSELKEAVARALPSLQDSVRIGRWNGENTTLESRCCGDAAPKLALLLRGLGFEVHLVEAELHYYLLYDGPEGQLIIDPTIRQFFGGPRAPASVPLVFVGTPAELNALFERHPRRSTSSGAGRLYYHQAVVRVLSPLSSPAPGRDQRLLSEEELEPLRSFDARVQGGNNSNFP